jgi:hypothetical protein
MWWHDSSLIARFCTIKITSKNRDVLFDCSSKQLLQFALRMQICTHFYNDFFCHNCNIPSWTCSTKYNRFDLDYCSSHFDHLDRVYLDLDLVHDRDHDRSNYKLHFEYRQSFSIYRRNWNDMISIRIWFDDSSNRHRERLFLRNERFFFNSARIFIVLILRMTSSLRLSRSVFII